MRFQLSSGRPERAGLLSPAFAALAAVATLAAMLPATPAMARDAACDRVVSATDKKLAAPAFIDHKELNGLVVELMLVNGQLYQRSSIGGGALPAWGPAQVKLADIKAAADAYRDKLSSCERLGTEAVEGTATEIYSFTVQAPEGQPVKSKVWIGTADGLPYREEAAGAKGSTRYRDVKVP